MVFKGDDPINLSELLHQQGYNGWPCIGLDEVGRGCLAGPVYAGAVLASADLHFWDLAGLTDSKLLTAKKREFLHGRIRESWTCSIGQASVQEVDQFNILQASFLAMVRAVVAIRDLQALDKAVLLVDGNQKLSARWMKQFALPENKWPQICIVGGDRRCEVISAASVYAKVERDSLMVQMEKSFPEYGFASHKGYGSAQHRKAIAEFGPTEHHRKSFAGVKEHLEAAHSGSLI